MKESRHTGCTATAHVDAKTDLGHYTIKVLQLYCHSFSPFRSVANRFRVTCHFENFSLNDPRITLNTTKRSKSPHYMFYWCLRVLNFTPICPTTNLFLAKGYCEKGVAPPPPHPPPLSEWPQIINLHHYKVPGTHIFQVR